MYFSISVFVIPIRWRI